MNQTDAFFTNTNNAVRSLYQMILSVNIEDYSIKKIDLNPEFSTMIRVY